MAMSSPPDCPFMAGSRLQDPSLFVGRAQELRQMVNLMTGVQPTSINVVGEARIGKSSLLYYFAQQWQQLPGVIDPRRYAVVYVSLQEAQCQREADFYRVVAQVLQQVPSVQQNRALREPLGSGLLDRAGFAAALARWKSRGVLPVLCLDDVEVWFADPQEFDDRFFNHLRSLMDRQALMLVIASRLPLEMYRRQRKLTSPFFQLGHVIGLREFADPEEVQQLLRVTQIPHRSPALSSDEQAAAQRWGGRHPYLLQLAGQMIWLTRQQGGSLTEARQEFAQQVRRIQGMRWDPRQWRRWLGWFVWELPLGIDQAVRGFGRMLNGWRGWVIVGAVVGGVILGILGALNWEQVREWIQTVLRSA